MRTLKRGAKQAFLLRHIRWDLDISIFRTLFEQRLDEVAPSFCLCHLCSLPDHRVLGTDLLAVAAV